MLGAALISLSACGDRWKASGGALPVLQGIGDPLTAQQLTTLIVSSTPPNPSVTTSTACSGNNGATAPCDDTEMLLSSISNFSSSLYDQSDHTKVSTVQSQNRLRSARNEIAGILLAESNNRCNAYKIALRNVSSTVTFGLGGTAAVLGGVGGLFTGGTAAIFSALSGATTGVNAEYSKDLFDSLTTSVIIPGIDKQRSAIFSEIAGRWCKPIMTYPLSLAIADVIRYHGACTIDTGIASASQSISGTKSSTNPTLEQTLKSISSISDTYAHLQSAAAPQPAAKPPAPKAAPAPKPASAENTQSGGSQQDSATSSEGAANPGTSAPVPTPLGTTVTLPDCTVLDQNGEATAATDSNKQASPAK